MTKEAFAERVVAMQDVLYRVSYSLLQNPHDQADAVQECIGRGLQRCGSLREEKYLQTWLIRILINTCHDTLRRRKREGPAETIEVIAPPQSDRDVVEALAALDPKVRLPLVLHYIEGYATREVAEMLRVPEGTVKWRLSSGRKLLRELLEEGGLWHEGT